MKKHILAVLLLVATARAEDASCFLRDGDVWVFHGDSITHADTYRRACERVFRSFHPDAKVEFIQAGVWGSTSSDLVNRLKADGRKPTVVSLMLGMNNAINSAWVKGEPRDKPLAAYRQDIVKFVQKCRADGAVVILMSPTLADETCRRTFWRLEGANDFLRDCGKIMKEVAAAEGAFFVPVQEEFEAYQETLERHQRLRPDGVHPASLGEYRIAQSLRERLNFAGPLAGKERKLTEPVSRSPVCLAPAVPELRPGEVSERVVTVSNSVFLVDYCAVPVLHFTNDVTAGTVSNIATWQLHRDAGALQLDVAVTTTQINSSSEWAFARNGLNMFFDLRPTNRFALINVDADVHQTMINMYEKPFVAAALRPWLGDGMDRAAVCSGEKTSTGYRIHFRVADRLNMHEPFALDKRDFIGFALAVVNAGAATEAFPAQRPRDQYANSLMVLDLKDRLKTNVMVNVHIYP